MKNPADSVNNLQDVLTEYQNAVKNTRDADLDSKEAFDLYMKKHENLKNLQEYKNLLSAMLVKLINAKTVDEELSIKTKFYEKFDKLISKIDKSTSSPLVEQSRSSIETQVAKVTELIEKLERTQR